MRKRWLTIKVFFIRLLITIKILKPVWYQSEIDLAKIRADEMSMYFNFKD